MVKMNEIETKSFEVVPVMIEVIDNQTGSKSIIRKYYSLGQKKNGDKYFKITGITENRAWNGNQRSKQRKR